MVPKTAADIVLVALLILALIDVLALAMKLEVAPPLSLQLPQVP